MEGDGCGTVIWLGLIAAVVWFAWLDDSAIRYEIQFDAEVVVEDRPRDCDFMTAPLGRKNCSYRKEVSVVLYSIGANEGEPIISYDEGETWYVNPGGPTSGKRVRVYWIRTES